MHLGLKWYRRAAERRALSAQAYAVASDKLTAKAPTYTGSWGVVLDIDETTLNNSTYQHERMELGLGFSPASWTTWVNRKAATPLDGAIDFINLVRTLGGKVLFVTNRMAATECAATETNLHAVGISYDAILCKTDTSDKNVRFNTLSQTHKLVMFVGDNIQDFPALTQEVRKQPASAFDRFGEDFILLPNSMYGSWEKNTDDNAL